MTWDRKLWGVEFTSPLTGAAFLSAAWHGVAARKGHAGEPPRALLFTTRVAARAWCATEQAKYAARQDCCSDWQFRVVRVREIVKKI